MERGDETASRQLEELPESNTAGGVFGRPVPHGVKKRVFLVDGQPLVREWLTHVLNKEPGMVVCGEAAGAVAAMRGITACHPHAVVMDLTLEDGAGLDLVEQILFRCPNVAVLVLSMHDDVYYADRALRAGAKGYIRKTEPTKRIVVALRRVLQGNVYLSRMGAQCLINRRAGELPPGGVRPIESLSDRELEVFAMVGWGLGTRRIAGMLHLSPKTIYAYRGRIKDKLRLCDANELMREAICWIERAGKRDRRTTRQPDYGGTAEPGHAA